MAAPEYVPRAPDDRSRVYESPPWRPEAWLADRPGDLPEGQPVGPGLGSPGPDQGFALKLARRFRGRLVLTPGEGEDDAVAGCVAVATKRASLLGRAPTIHDLTAAFTVWGFLSEADPALVAARRERFAAVSLPAHHLQRRAVADAVPAELLRLPHQEIARLVEADPTRARTLALAAHAA